MDRRIVVSGLLAAGGFAFSDAFAGINLGDAQAQAGLRDMLNKGADSSTARLGKPDGYWGDDVVRIPLPKSLATAGKLAKVVGQSGMFDDLHLRINRGAEAAAPLAKDLFHDAIKTMTITDAAGIVRGGPTSGTQYLQDKTTPRLTTAFTPIVENTLQSTGAVEYLDRLVRRNKLDSVVKGDAKTWLGKYTVGLALNGLFHYIGVEETSIRRSPAKNLTGLLKIFG